VGNRGVEAQAKVRRSNALKSGLGVNRGPRKEGQAGSGRNPEGERGGKLAVKRRMNFQAAAKRCPHVELGGASGKGQEASPKGKPGT